MVKWPRFMEAKARPVYPGCLCLIGFWGSPLGLVGVVLSVAITMALKLAFQEQ